LKKLLSILLFVPATWVSGADFSTEIYLAYLANRMDIWKAIMVEMEEAYGATGDHELLWLLTDAQYGYIGYRVSMKHKKEARVWLEKAEQNVERLIGLYPSDSRAFSLKGALYGYRIILEPWKAPVLGVRSIKASDRARELDPDEPRVWMERGNMEFYKPGILGGSAAEAVTSYARAVEIYESKPGKTRQNWLYMNCLVNLGLALEATGQIEEAGAVYRKTLKMEPCFSKVKDEIYPGYLKRHCKQ